MRVGIIRSAVPPQAFSTLRAIAGRVGIGEPAIWVDSQGEEWFVISDERITPQHIGRIVALGQRKAYVDPGPAQPGDERDEVDREMQAQGQVGQNPVAVKFDEIGLTPKAA